MYTFRVRSLDEDGVEPGGGDGGQHDPGRAAHQVAPAAPHDAGDLGDLAHGGHGQGQRLESKHGLVEGFVAFSNLVYRYRPKLMPQVA